MCVIVDINIASRVLLTRDDPDFNLINAALMKRRLVLVYGGKLAKEYSRHGEVCRFVNSLGQAGIAHIISKELIDGEIKWLETQGECVSNDKHILALARASAARLLCSDDQNLICDFGNKRIINQPRGKTYKNSQHKHLLKKACQIRRNKSTG